MLARSMNRSFLTTAALLAVSLSAATSQAEVSFTWATVGNAGNAADPNTGSLYGAVAYEYRIATTEVTNAQYAEFLNAVAATDTYNLYNTGMASNFGGITRSGTSGGYTYATVAGRANNPVTYVSWYDAARFSNWMTNGQGAGSTESGVYTLTGATSISGITRDLNNPNQVFIPTESEWYKSAYHDATAGTAGTYFTYATGSNSVPISDQPGDDASAVNYYNNDGVANGFNDGYAVWDGTGTGNPFTDVGAYTDADSPYGTFDQNGNVWEWNEELIGSSRGLRGGSWVNDEIYLRSSSRVIDSPRVKYDVIGFRVASPAAAVVPSPSAALSGLALLGALMTRRTRRRR